MARVTITLSDERYERLKRQAEHTHQAISELVERELAEADRARRSEALAILEDARAHARSVEPHLTDDEIMEIAVAETRAYRREKRGERDAAGHP